MSLPIKAMFFDGSFFFFFLRNSVDLYLKNIPAKKKKKCYPINGLGGEDF